MFILVILTIWKGRFAKSEEILAPEMSTTIDQIIVSVNTNYSISEKIPTIFLLATSDSIKKNEISLLELNSIISQFGDCFVHIASDYHIADISNITNPFSIFNSDAVNLKNIPSRYLSSVLKCRAAIFVFYNGEQQLRGDYKGLYLDSCKTQNSPCNLPGI